VKKRKPESPKKKEGESLPKSSADPQCLARDDKNLRTAGTVGVDRARGLERLEKSLDRTQGLRERKKKRVGEMDRRGGGDCSSIADQTTLAYSPKKLRRMSRRSSTEKKSMEA